jgi:predicted permease
VILELVPVLLPIVLTAGIGYLWARSPHPFDLAFVTRLIATVGSPCLTFSVLTRLQVDGGTILFQMMLGLITVAACLAVGAVALRLLRYPVRPFLPTVALPNAGNLGLPIALFAFGNDGLAMALPFSAAMVLCQFTIGIWCASGRAGWRELVRAPAIYAIAAALAFAYTGAAVPAWLANVTDLVGGLMLPLMLIALGVSLANLRVGHLGRAAVLGALRLVLGLGAGVGLATLLALPPPAWGVLILQAAMPPAVFNYLFAARYGGPAEEVAGAVVVGTAIGFLALPFLLAAVM